MVGSTWKHVEGEPVSGPRARYWLTVQAGSTDLGGVIEIVEWDPPHELAWTNVSGIDNRGRWILRDRGESSQVTLRFSYQVPGGILALIASRLSAPIMRRDVRQSLDALKTWSREVADELPAARPVGHILADAAIFDVPVGSVLLTIFALNRWGPRTAERGKSLAVDELSNEELVDNGYAAWNEDDLEGMLDYLPPRGQLPHQRGLSGAPDAVYQGEEGIRRWWDDFHEPWSEIKVIPERIAEDGDEIAILIRFEGTGRRRNRDEHAFINTIELRDRWPTASARSRPHREAARELGLD